jgi:quinol monooxygenase YgiN
MTLRFRVPVAQTLPISEALHSLATGIRSWPGCRSCLISTKIADHGTVRYVEKWDKEDDLRRRLFADTFLHLISLIETEDAIQPPEIEFILANGTRGFDFVKEVREVMET